MNWFSYEQISPRLVRIRDASLTAVYLVLGDDKVALLDTGIGLGSLREYISALTPRPVDMVILTHGHLDHANGAGEFADVPVYLNPLDKDLMRRHADVQKRIDYARDSWQHTGQTPPVFTAKDTIPALDPEKTLPLEDGQRIDLGGISIEAIHTPGHTQGMTMLLLPEERTILFGDGCGVGVLLVEDCCSTVEAYRQSLARVKKYEPRYDRIIRNHGTCESPKELLDNVIAVCDDILAGTDDHIPATAPIACTAAVYMAKATRPGTQNRVDGREGNILYAANKIR